MMYRWHPGYLAWLLNRVTGLAVTLYLGVHIWVIHHLSQGRQGFDRVMHFIQSPVTMVFELLLIGAVLYHGINGVRIMLVEFAGVSRHQKVIFVGVLAFTGILFLSAVVAAIPHLVSH
ncbi:MAG: succinate dehydrogenase, cytochrome b556 subunit [Candidatus Eisenbacteria bacterium]|jgi:succinate dehydrogenase / fumarate reductase cytochrome b subunit|nr:succinate dehydrogenase, cytochrome b556 subunit [Candidatus Eisenbacteria bacterium]